MRDTEVKKKLGKTLRVIRATLATGYDIETKLVLVAYAMELRYWRKDWCVWPGTRAIAQMTSLSRGTVISRRRQLVSDGVMTLIGSGEDGHDLNRTHFNGRPTHVYQINVKKLEALTRDALFVKDLDEKWFRDHPMDSREERDATAPGVNEESAR
jgi:hypothetical protein